jgi:hypothetical protein
MIQSSGRYSTEHEGVVNELRETLGLDSAARVRWAAAVERRLELNAHYSSLNPLRFT